MSLRSGNKNKLRPKIHGEGDIIRPHSVSLPEDQGLKVIVTVKSSGCLQIGFGLLIIDYI